MAESHKSRGVAQDMLSSDVVGAPLHQAFIHEVNRMPKDDPQLFPHRQKIIELPPRLRCKSCQNVNVAVGAEVIAEDRTKQGQFGNPPAAAEVCDLLP